MSFDIALIKAWMADHVFLSVAIAVLLTVILMLLARDTLKRLHLRLFQIATLSLIGIGMVVITSGLNDRHMLSIGAAILMAAALGYYAGMRLKTESGGSLKAANDELANTRAELKKLKENPAIRLVVEQQGSGKS